MQDIVMQDIVMHLKPGIAVGVNKAPMRLYGRFASQGFLWIGLALERHLCTLIEFLLDSTSLPY